MPFISYKFVLKIKSTVLISFLVVDEVMQTLIVDSCNIF